MIKHSKVLNRDSAQRCSGKTSNYIGNDGWKAVQEVLVMHDR